VQRTADRPSTIRYGVIDTWLGQPMQFDQLKRREFITLVGGAAAWPIAAAAQHRPVVGFMSARSPETSADLLAAFRRGLAQIGFVEGQNVAIEVRWTRGEYNIAAALAADLASHRMAVIAVAGSPLALAAKAATSTIPIVFSVASDPVEAGLVASLNRPGGNLTGMTTLSVEGPSGELSIDPVADERLVRVTVRVGAS